MNDGQQERDGARKRGRLDVIIFPVRIIKPFGPVEQAEADSPENRLELKECIKNETK